jgi:predicted  nucleic acid-binding Zn-ribbon protein
MLIEQLHANIHQLESKLIQLKEKYEQQKSIIQKLEQENEQLKNTLEQRIQQPILGDEKQKINSILQNLAQQKDKDIKKVFERYIKHIDQCIALLEKFN